MDRWTDRHNTRFVHQHPVGLSFFIIPRNHTRDQRPPELLLNTPISPISALAVLPVLREPPRRLPIKDRQHSAGGLIDQAARERWQKVATEEVIQAVKEAASSTASKSGTSTPSGTVPPAPPAAATAASNDKTPTVSQQQATTEVPMRPAAVKV